MIQRIIENYKIILGVLALIGFEIAPIKFSPISWIGKLIGKFLGIQELKKEIEDIKQEVNTNELDRIRYEILQFSGSLRNGLERTNNDYQHIEELFSKYEKKGGNSYIKSEMEFIRTCKNKVKRRRKKEVQ